MHYIVSKKQNISQSVICHIGEIVSEIHLQSQFDHKNVKNHKTSTQIIVSLICVTLCFLFFVVVCVHCCAAGMIDCPGTQDGSSLRSLIDKPPVCGNSFSPLTGALLTGFRLHTGPVLLQDTTHTV